MNGETILKTAEKYKIKSGKYFCKQYGYNFICDWCVIYVWYVFKAAKASDLLCSGLKVENVGTLDNWLREHCKKVSIKDAQAGDIAIMCWSGQGNNTQQGSRDHTGIVVSSLGSTSIKTIEGNTGGVNGNFAATSGVFFRTRYAANIYAIYRPNYPNTDIDIDTLVKNVLLGKYGNGNARKKALGKNYNKVQEHVNKIVALTDGVLKGKYGNGDVRKKALGDYYDLVQWNINRIKK